jgi:hypothetical protein
MGAAGLHPTGHSVCRRDRSCDAGPAHVPFEHARRCCAPDLDAGEPYFVDEDMPRSGTRVTLRYQRARWYDGRVVV